MYKEKTVAVVVPAYNEEKQIGTVIETMPDFVDRIVIVNDGSKDRTADTVCSYIEKDCPSGISICLKKPVFSNSRYDRADRIAWEIMQKEDTEFPIHSICNDNDVDRIVLINEENSKVGRAVATGCKWCRDHDIDCTAVMDGDGQMDPAELESIIAPVCTEGVDYVKGNRLSHKSAKVLIPRIRHFGNMCLSLMTKIASGYWSISDTQTGYIAISKHAINAIPLHKIYYSYGYPNDIIVKLNIENCTIREVPIKPVYDIGEQSKLKIRKVIPRILGLLIKNFFLRIWVKYFKTSFHPLFLFYMTGIFLWVLNIPFFFSILINVIIRQGHVTTGIYMAFILLTLFSFQSIGFGMWMDIQDNAHLNR